VRRATGRTFVWCAALIVAGAALSAWQSGLSRDSSAAHWSTALLIVAAFATAPILGRGRQRQPSGSWLASAAHAVRSWRTQSTPAAISVIVWSVLITATVSWDMVSFISQQHALPTLSYFIGHVTRYATGRGALFALWLAIGAYLVAGWRTPSGGPCP
jgi:hypothetical protein